MSAVHDAGAQRPAADSQGAGAATGRRGRATASHQALPTSPSRPPERGRGVPGAVAERKGWPGQLANFVAQTALATLLGLPAAAQELRSGYEDMSADIQAMQDDDFLNPGMLWVDDGARLWSEAPASGPACARCHGQPETMQGVATRYPVWDEQSGAAVDLERRINLCRTRHQDAEPFPRESRPLLALTALVANQSRGLPIAPPDDPHLAPARELGRTLYTTPMGQLDLSCAECHDDNAGRRLAAATIPQGHPTGYPLYRLQWETLGSLDRRFRNCFVGVRAEPYAPGSPEYIALKAYLAERAAGLPLETPAVRP